MQNGTHIASPVDSDGLQRSINQQLAWDPAAAGIWSSPTLVGLCPKKSEANP